MVVEVIAPQFERLSWDGVREMMRRLSIDTRWLQRHTVEWLNLKF